jgi:hypothetical protein
MPIANFGFAVPGAAAAVVGHPQGLAAVGLVIPVEIHIPATLAAQLQQAQQPVPPPQTGYALVDTGAGMTSCHDAALRALGLNPVGQQSFGTANGPVQQYLYPANIRLPAQNWGFDLATVAGADLTGQIIPLNPPQQLLVLIGRDLLSNMTLHWNGPAGVCTLSL